MCSPATCRTCGKATYTGCGQHVDQVLAGVPTARRCTCDARGSTPAGVRPAPPDRRRGWFGGLRRGGAR